jgi:hypothetical protein
MPDGQLKSHSIRVYVTQQINPEQLPKLKLLRDHAVSKPEVESHPFREPGVVAPNQEWTESIDGQQVRRTGTLMLFDFNNIDFDYKAMFRVMPVVTWTDGKSTRCAVSLREVNVGNIVNAVCWTGLILFLTLGLIILLSWCVAGNPLRLLLGVDGHLSLAQTQIACWTVAIAGIVLLYGLIKLDIPNIPESLLVLMGASLATGGIGFFGDAKKKDKLLRHAIAAQVAAAPNVAPPNAAVVAIDVRLAARPLKLGDLVRELPSTQPEPELSLAKAQMLFWTIILIVIFIVKSLLDGVIWDVPWQLVALMGFSQAGFVLPKVTPPSAPQ